MPSLPPTDEEYVMPCAEAMLAGTLALMTGYAQSGCARQRAAMAAQIRSNLGELSRHAGLTLPFRTMADRLRQRWELTAAVAEGQPPLPESRLWLAAAPLVQ